MDQVKTDMVMRFKRKGGQDVWAESMLRIADDDLMMRDFQRDTAYDDYSNFFEISDFNFRVELRDEDENISALSQPASKTAKSSSPVKGGFVRWRSASDSDYRNIHYPLSFDTFEFTRLIDGASPTFFQCCCNTESFDQAVLVKRVSRGMEAGIQLLPVGYLRIDFTDVLVIGVNWDDGDVVKEKCSFICREFKLNYQQQAFAGGLHQAKSHAHWRQPRAGNGS